MVFRIFLLIFEIFFVFWSLKSDFWIKLLQNVPYIGVVADAISGLTGFSSAGLAFPSQPFSEEILKALIFTCSYPILELAVKCFCGIIIGKHSYHRDLKEAIDGMIVSFLSSILTAIVTSLFMEYVYLALTNWASSFIPWLKYLISFLSVSSVLAIAFLLFGQGVLVFFMWILTKFLIPTALKIISVEILVILLHLLLNIPSMMESVTTIVIMCIGIACCLGAIFGVSIYDRRIDDYWRPGKHGSGSYFYLN